jgi:hypothetical protein
MGIANRRLDNGAIISSSNPGFSFGGRNFAGLLLVKIGFFYTFGRKLGPFQCLTDFGQFPKCT